MALPFTALKNITELAGWGAASNLIASGRGSLEIWALRALRRWAKAGFHGLALPWTSLKSIADFACETSTACLVQTETGTEMIKLLRTVTAQAITHRHWAEVARSWGAHDRYRLPGPPSSESDDDWETAMWRRWAGDD
jgi:hypothetical protein